MNLKQLYKTIIRREKIGKNITGKYQEFGLESYVYRPYLGNKEYAKISIGNRTTILNNSRLQILKTKYNPHITIGDDCYICYNFTALAGADISIGNGVVIASYVLITSENHGMNPESEMYYKDQGLECKTVKIGEGCWIGERACILPGVEIGKKCIIGAGSVVTHNVDDFCLVAGVPARVIKKYDFENHIWKKVDENGTE